MKTYIGNNKIETIAMTSIEKEQVWNRVAQRTFHKGETALPVRNSFIGRLYYRGLRSIPRKSYAFHNMGAYTVACLILTLITSSTLSVFAQDTLPGDLLYPVKTQVNEKILVVLASTPEEKAKREAVLAARRLEEAETLVLVGKGDPLLIAQVNEAFSAHAQNFQKQLEKLQEQKKFSKIVNVGVFFQTRIAVHAAILRDIEIHHKIMLQEKKDRAVYTFPAHTILVLEKTVLTAAIPTVHMTAEALHKISKESETSLVSQTLTTELHIDHDEAKLYLQTLNTTVGIPLTLLENVPLVTPPVFVP